MKQQAIFGLHAAWSLVINPMFIAIHLYLYVRVPLDMVQWMSSNHTGRSINDSAH